MWTLRLAARRDPHQPQERIDMNAAPQNPTPATVAAQNRRTAPERISGAKAIVRSLEELGADVVFGIPGGAILPLYDPLYDSEKIRHVLVRHEQGAGHA